VVPHAVEEYGHERIVRFAAMPPLGESTEVDVNALLSGPGCHRSRRAAAPWRRHGAHLLHFFDPASGNTLGPK
jgi:hypothetical protein